MDFLHRQPPRIRTALALSIAGHLCALSLLALLLQSVQVPSSSVIDEAPVFAVTTIVHRAPPPASSRAEGVRRPTPDAHIAARPSPAPRAVAPAARASAMPAAPIRAAAPVRSGTPLRRTALRAPSDAKTPAAALPAYVAAERLALGAAPTDAPATPAPTPLPSPTPSAAPAATNTPAAPASFGGLFSQNYPPALPAPSIVETIQARLGGHGRIAIDVDETGHATGLRFLDAVVDDAAAQDVRAQLLGLTYVPADCNGLHCDGTLDVKY